MSPEEVDHLLINVEEAVVQYQAGSTRYVALSFFWEIS